MPYRINTAKATMIDGSGQSHHIDVFCEQVDSVRDAVINAVNAAGDRIARINNAGAATIDETASMIAEDFDETKAYTAGTYVRKTVTSGNTTEVKLFRLTADYAANSSWNSASKAEVILGNDVNDLRSVVNAEPYTSSSFLQGARWTEINVTQRNDRCTTYDVFSLKAGDKIGITNPTQRISAIAGVKNDAFVYDPGWQSGNQEYTVTAQTEGVYFVNFAYSVSGENISPSDLVGVQVTITRKTAITDLQESVDAININIASMNVNLSDLTGIDLAPTVSWQRGTIADGVDSSNIYRIRSDYISTSSINHVVFNIASGYRFFYCLYNANKSFIGNSNWLLTTTSVQFPEDIAYVRLVIGPATDNNQIGVEANRKITAVAYYILNKTVKSNLTLFDTFRNLSDDISINSWVIGYIYAGGSIDTTDQPNYVCMSTVISFPIDICVSVRSGYQFMVRMFDASGAITSTTTWLTDEYIIHAGTLFAINMSKITPEAVVNINDYIAAINIRSRALNNIDFPANIKKIAILGDSISTYDGWIETGYNAAYYPKHDITDVNQTWWYIVADALGVTDGITVSAISQSAYVDFSNAMYPPVYTTSRIERLGASGAPDLILVNVGTNDGVAAQNTSIAYTANVSELEALANSTVRGIELTIRKLQTAYPAAKIVMMIPKQVKLSDMPTGYDLERVTKIADEIKACAEIFGVWKVIDLRACGINQTNVASYCGDGNIHPNASGMRKIADYIIQELLK